MDDPALFMPHLEFTQNLGLTQNRGMHPHRVQLLHAEVSVHPHRVQMHPALVHFGDYDDKSFLDFEYTHKAIVGFISTKWFCYESNSSKQR